MLRSRRAARVGRSGFRTASRGTPAPSEPGPTMLVVEDDPETRELLAEVLRAEGYDVVEACDGEDAREQVADRRLVIVLTAETATRLGEPGTAALVGSPAVQEARDAPARPRASSRRASWERDGHVV